MHTFRSILDFIKLKINIKLGSSNIISYHNKSIEVFNA